jgi:hypothetical protein
MNEPLGLAKLSKTHVAGDLKFDPLNLKPRTDKDLRAMRTKEVRAPYILSDCTLFDGLCCGWTD